MSKAGLSIVGQGDGWLCCEKPWGMSVHNEPGKDLVSVLARQLYPGRNKGDALVQPVHRLDKETSGLILLATDARVLKRLSDLFARGRVKKQYQALVHGNFQLPAQARGLWDAPLAKTAGGRNNPAGKGKKVRAVTRYWVADQSPHYALVEITLETGRKHQIRRHARMAGHPIVGDRRYSSLRAVRFLAEQRGFCRLGLHAARLAFQDQDRAVTLESQGLPREMADLLSADQAASV